MPKINKMNQSSSAKECAFTASCPSGIASAKTSKKAWS